MAHDSFFRKRFVIPFDDVTTLFKTFDPVTIRRALTLQADDNVLDLDVETLATGVNLTAHVMGSRSQPYSTHVGVRRHQQNNLIVTSRCTCPVETLCKHAAAVLLEWKDQLEETRGEVISQKEANEVMSQPVALDSDVRAWLDKIAAAEKKEIALQKVRGANIDKFVAYVLEKHDYYNTWSITANRATREPRKTKIGLTPIQQRLITRETSASYVEETDLSIAENWPSVLNSYHHKSNLIAASGGDLLQQTVATGRAYHAHHTSRPLSWQAPRKAHFTWESDDAGNFKLTLTLGAKRNFELIQLSKWYWLDVQAFQIGEIDLPVSPERARLLLNSPTIPAGAIDLLSDALPDSVKSQVASLPAKRAVTRVEVLPVPVLVVKRESVKIQRYALLPETNYRYDRHSHELIKHEMPLVKVLFDYAGHRFRFDDDGSEAIKVDGETITRIVRNLGEEQRRLKELAPARLVTLTQMSGVQPSLDQARLRSLPPHMSDGDLSRTLQNIVPQLVAKGWQFDMPAHYGLQVVHLDDNDAAFDLNLKPDDQNASGAQMDWFDIEIGTRIDGAEVDLAPIILAWLATLKPGARVERIESLLHFETGPAEILLPLSKDRLIALNPIRLKPILEALLKIFSPREITEGVTKVPSDRMAELVEIEGLNTLTKDWANGSKGARLVQALATWSSRPETKIPDHFKTVLRPYQKQGLEWLQLLYEVGMGGCLADDMGLGKTVQTLAHICVLKEQGQLKQPVLIIAPTSVLPNWVHEAERFAPNLKVLALSGPDRADLKHDIDGADVLLSSYALLPRDEEWLCDRTFSLVVFDEAQNIRNPTTAAAKAAFKLKAHQHIALSGTPIENHLGDVWSLMRFLNPGLLGSQKQFQADFRKPIEKDNDLDARARLARRIRPFLLRRTKSEVATDLPDRTETNHDIILNETQRDLYEATRTAMQQRVITAMGAKGLAGSAIIVLDALLKLRQVCCDPRLVKTATKTALAGGSAKLAYLLDMLQELKAEGRRVLVFSQFTSMLELIRDELAALGLTHEWLTGSTRDRDGPVRRFQAGEADLFLISTKAGGVGLNLTAADTIVLFDPWWNPAVEAQAIGRAHRIGQNRPVFVHRLICEGTIEEKMLALQARKLGLSDAIWNHEDQKPDAKSVAGLSEEDVIGLFD